MVVSEQGKVNPRADSFTLYLNYVADKVLQNMLPKSKLDGMYHKIQRIDRKSIKAPPPAAATIGTTQPQIEEKKEKQTQRKPSNNKLRSTEVRPIPRTVKPKSNKSQDLHLDHTPKKVAVKVPSRLFAGTISSTTKEMGSGGMGGVGRSRSQVQDDLKPRRMNFGQKS